MDDNATPDQVRGERSGRTLVGSADHVAEQVQAKVLDAGIDGVIISQQQYTPGVVAAVGDALRPLVGLSAQRGVSLPTPCVWVITRVNIDNCRSGRLA